MKTSFLFVLASFFLFGGGSNSEIVKDELHIVLIEDYGLNYSATMKNDFLEEKLLVAFFKEDRRY